MRSTERNSHARRVSNPRYPSLSGMHGSKRVQVEGWRGAGRVIAQDIKQPSTPRSSTRPSNMSVVNQSDSGMNKRTDGVNEIDTELPGYSSMGGCGMTMGHNLEEERAKLAQYRPPDPSRYVRSV